jgi:hypothetical protein
VVEVFLPSFQNFRTSGSDVLVKSLFSNKGAKIKEKEKIGGVIKQRNYAKVFGSHKLTLGLKTNA